MSKDAQIAQLREALYYMLYPDEMPCSDLAKDKAQSLAQPLEHAWAEYVLAATKQEEQ